MSDTIIFCDGLCEPTNPKGYACWAYAVLRNGKEVHHAFNCLGHGEGMTNNLAEYSALLHALGYLYRNQIKDATIKTDSQLVVQQVNGNWKCNKEHLRELRDRCRKGMTLTNATLTWVPREQNELADRYSREAYQVAKRRTTVLRPVPA